MLHGVRITDGIVIINELVNIQSFSILTEVVDRTLSCLLFYFERLCSRWFHSGFVRWRPIIKLTDAL